jgi:hypothetical protein
MKLARVAGAFAALVFSMAMASAANATVTLVQPTCNIYTNGCLFTYTQGGEFDDASLIVQAYNAIHAAAPPPEDLPNLTFLGKAEQGGSIAFSTSNGGNTWTFANLPWNVSYYMVKQASGQFILFGLNPATNSFSATNTQIDPQGISHVSFFGGGGAVPEPATWAMMILGFGMVGMGLRLRRRPDTAIA